MPLDDAYKRAYTTLKTWERGEDPRGADLSETDTRAKVLDPILRDVLGWAEGSIRREEPSAEGFADYTLFRDTRRFALVEAKRCNPRFELPTSVARTPALIGGPGFSSKPVQEAIRQAAAYGPALGCPFCVVTNGHQFIVFPSFSDVPLAERKAIAFTDLLNKEQFARFFELLRYEAIVGGSLYSAFLSLQKAQALHVPLDYIPAPDKEFNRNRLWSILNHLATRVLEDRPESRLEIIENCYVVTRESSETDSALRNLIGRAAPPLIRDTGAALVKPTPRGRTSFGHALEGAVKERKSGVYVVTGGVGAGKTTFLGRFEHLIEPGLVKEWCAWFQLDFLPSGKPAHVGSGEIESFVLKSIRLQLSTRYFEELKVDGAGLRALFAARLAELEHTRLYGVPTDSGRRLEIINDEIAALYASDEHFVRAAIDYLVSRGRRVVFVFDNSDQLGEDFQERVFLLAKAFQDQYRAISIVSLREEKFYAAYYRGVFNAFPTVKFHIGSPDLQEVLRRRLEYGMGLMQRNPEEFFPPFAADSHALGLADCIDLLNIFLRSVTRKNRNIVRMVESVAVGNTRFGLEMFRDFVGSGNTDVEKILRITRSEGGYTVPFHEFAKSVMLGNREFYRAGASVIANVFARSGAPRSSHFVTLRVLAYLDARHNVSSSRGSGFVDAEIIRREYIAAFDSEDDLAATLGHLVRVRLIDSEPPRASDGKAEAYKIAAAGSYYLRYLAKSFAYIDLVMVDTALADEELSRHIASVARAREMDIRIGRVRRFLEYLSRTETAELSRAPVDAPFAAAVMPDIVSQLAHEIALMERQARMRRVHSPALAASGR